MNILDLLKEDGHEVNRVANIHGGEYAGPCPACGGYDRFRVWPEEKDGRYWCRQCNKSGDRIQYLRDFRGMTYPQACQYLGEAPNKRRYSALQRRDSKPVFIPKEPTVPGPIWQEKARGFLDMAVKILWSDAGNESRTFLYRKGLADETIRAAGLGWNRQDIFIDRTSWGLPPAQQTDGKSKKLWIPAGLVIPGYVDGKVVRLKIRRNDPGDGPRYVVISGSDSRPMTCILDKGTVVIVESELDGLLLHQEAGDLVGVVALGSASFKPDTMTHEALKQSEKILVSLDRDDAGAKAASSFWADTYSIKAKRWPCVLGKDPSDAWQKGLNIRSWVVAGISN